MPKHLILTGLCWNPRDANSRVNIPQQYAHDNTVHLLNTAVSDYMGKFGLIWYRWELKADSPAWTYLKVNSKAYGNTFSIDSQ